MPDTELRYRIASHADVAALMDLGLAAYGEYAAQLTPDNWQTMKSNLESKDKMMALLDVATCFVAESDGRIVGMAFFVPSGNPSHIYPAEWSYIRMVGVYANFRGLGIGKKLTQQCIALATQTGERTIALHTSEIMHAARATYERLGFTIVRELPLHLGIRYWVYSLSLQSAQ